MFPCAEVVYKCESFASLGVGFGVFVTKKCPGVSSQTNSTTADPELNYIVNIRKNPIWIYLALLFLWKYIYCGNILTNIFIFANK